MQSVAVRLSSIISTGTRLNRTWIRLEYMLKSMTRRLEPQWLLRLVAPVGSLPSPQPYVVKLGWYNKALDPADRYLVWYNKAQDPAEPYLSCHLLYVCVDFTFESILLSSKGIHLLSSWNMQASIGRSCMFLLCVILHVHQINKIALLHIHVVSVPKKKKLYDWVNSTFYPLIIHLWH